MVSYLTILGRTGGGGGRGWGSRVERKVKERERNRKGRGEGPFISSRDVCSTMHICIRIQAERSMYKWDKVVPRGGIAPGWKYASGRLTKARESSVWGGGGGGKGKWKQQQQQSPGAGNKRRWERSNEEWASYPATTTHFWIFFGFCLVIRYNTIQLLALQNLFVFNQF